MGIIPWSPVAAGSLTRPLAAAPTTRFESEKSLPWGVKFKEGDDQIIQRVEEVAKKKGWSMVQVALAWISTKVASPIVGISSIKRLEENVIPGYVLTEEEIKYLEEPWVLILFHCGCGADDDLDMYLSLFVDTRRGPLIVQIRCTLCTILQ